MRMKRKFAVALLMVMALLCIIACSSDPQQQDTAAALTNSQSTEAASVIEQKNMSNLQEPTESKTEEILETGETSGADGGKILVAYFSRTGENYSVGVIEKGNTHIVADMIAQKTGGDIFEIRTVTPYPEIYNECTEVARQEKDNNARPELAGRVERMEDYDIIFLGYPIWWGDMPMAVYTFLEDYDFSGKTIVPFSTHEGSGLASTESSITRVCPDAEVLDGLTIRGSVAQNSQNEAEEAVINWLKETGFLD